MSGGVNFYNTCLQLDLPGLPRHTDKDGVQDSEDACPDAPGLPALKGCPDRDADTVTDKDDQCPALTGLPAHAGYPNADHDGLYFPEAGCSISDGGRRRGSTCAGSVHSGAETAAEQAFCYLSGSNKMPPCYPARGHCFGY